MRVRCTGEGDIALPNTSLERTPRSRPNRRKAPWSEQLSGGAAQLEAVVQRAWVPLVLPLAFGLNGSSVVVRTAALVAAKGRRHAQARGRTSHEACRRHFQGL